MALDLFNRRALQSIKQQLHSTKTEYNQIMTKTMNDLDRMINREKSSLSLSSLTNDIDRIGDPYFYNIYVRKAIDKIAGTISSVAFDIVNQNDLPLAESTREQKLFRYINDDDSSTDFIYEIVRSIQRAGKVFIAQYPLNSLEFPSALDILPFDKVKINTSHTHWEYSQNKKVYNIPKERMIFIRYRHPENSYDGLAPGSSAVKEILLDYYSQVYNIINFQNGNQGKGVWVDPAGKTLTPQQKIEAQHAVDNEFNRGVDSAGQTTVLSRRLEWIRTSESNKEMEYQALANKMRDDILVAYDIPKVLFASAESTFSNLKEAKTMFWTTTLQPIMDLIQTSFNTNFFNARGLSYKFRFRYEDISELQDDYHGKLQDAQVLYSMNIPMSVINETLDLELPVNGWEGWDRPALTPMYLESKPQLTKDLYKDFIKQQRIEEEKRINIDEFARHVEYQKSFQTMLQYEKQLHNKVETFFKSKYKDIEVYLEQHPIVEIKSLVDPNWIDSFKLYLLRFHWGEQFFISIKDVIENTFQRGRFRTYSGIGADFALNPDRAINFISNRGLKLQGSPDVVIESLIHMMESDKFTIDQASKLISSQWKEATLARAKNIAITETTNAYNGGRIEAMKELGIKKKEWVNSGDGQHVRDSHQISQVVNVDEDFTLADGERVRWPGDGSAANACNCRCTVISVLD